MNNQHLNATNKNDPARLVSVRALVQKKNKNQISHSMLEASWKLEHTIDAYLLTGDFRHLLSVWMFIQSTYSTDTLIPL